MKDKCEDHGGRIVGILTFPIVKYKGRRYVIGDDYGDTVHLCTFDLEKVIEVKKTKNGFRKL